jgi:hypothetical protein
MSRRLVAVSDWLYVKTASVLALVVLAALAIAIATVLLVMVLLALPVAAGLLAIFATIQGAKWVLVDHRERRRAADLGAVLGYRGWSGRVEDLPTIADEQRNVRPKGGQR